ncbi:magnesium-protoporphyrin O-methyltransferase BchH subunit [Bradyrhizobium sp. ORS 285]|uniref:magnesium chelatase subunit H n=1 Tax=Bradyrhizobium sp. ORS 285 TaxID=115808 RepID=UPI0002406E2E|nr:magnesium chelatase subunit H [Bradyrhizobium sp. ORS 285]CCD90190.1 magnesium-protoporphyrin O-methyltransferase BchH subunit [Bradyrhizobium sp. ORS 285]SMX60545.1 magnesium-protoporphyrin O-methyltransferase BchH subunit [Bradyrhizobium sp. ORS 285]
MPKRISVADVTPIRVVIVTMDSHLASAAVRARTTLQAELPGLDLKVHAADEWGCNPTALEHCLADIATGDIVVATMLFMEDHIQPVLPALQARRDHCDAMIGCLSAGEVVRLTRLGKLTMSGSATGVLGLLKRLRGSNRSGNASGQGQMKMLQRMPRLLRYIPGTAQDLRAYFLTLQYWLAGSEQNFANMVRFLVGRYADGPRAALRGKLKAAEPVTYPDVGLYHPLLKQRIAERIDELPALPKPAGRVGIILMRSYLLAANTAHYDGVIAALEARGLAVVPVFACGLDSRPAIERYFQKDGISTVDAVVSLTGFSLVGGPAYNDARAAEEVMAGLDVPLIAAHPLEFQTVEQWHDDARGLTPVEATMMVAIPELDGAVGPTVFGGRSAMADAGRDMASLPERAAQLASRVARIVELRRSARAERKIAAVLFNFPPNGGSAGTAAYLSVFESLHNVMTSLRAAGYTIDVPATVDELRARVLKGNAARFGTVANVAVRIPVDQHVRRERHLAEIEKQWGPAPGRHQTDGASLMVLGEQFGNLFVGLQPAFGYEGDPMRLLFEHSFAPTHAFAAFYRWLREEYRAHAVLHFGTHGALEFMPGKQAGLSAECWPERLIGDLPNFYIYASNNPSEGALAKRRGGATLISYLTPSITSAGLYKGLADLKSSLDAWRNLSPDATEQVRADSAALIQAQAAAVDLSVADPLWGDERDDKIAALSASVLELEYSLIPHGLHVVGAPPLQEQRAELLDLAGITDAAKRAELDTLLATDSETPAILHALDGGYIRPVPGGDLLRNTDVLPTGRNLHGFDPFRIPSAFALKDAERQVARLLARHAGEGHTLPETIALVLWGTDNLKTEGGPIAQALWLMGAAPRHDSYGRLCGAKLIPLEQLGRPRIDVVITLSGIFRDLMPLQTKLLAEAALLAASADESAEFNYVRKHALAFQAAHGGEIADAALRVFGNAEGAYGANVNHLIDCGAWTDEDELADVYTRRKGFAYGTDGRPVRRDALLGHVLAGVDAAYQNVDSVELGVTTIDHYFDTLGGISRAVKRARGEAAPVYIGDQTRGEGTVRTLSEQVALETRTRTLNPKWYEALLAHGYEGVRQIESHVTNTVGWSATTGQVAPWVYQQITTTFVLDPAMRERLASLNPAASAKIANRLIEAHERNYWTPDAEMLDVLRKAGEELEDRLEGVGVAA